MAQSFDSNRLVLMGDPFPVAEQVQFGPFNPAALSASKTGTIAYRTGTTKGLPIRLVRPIR
ncbi:MAG: hypothetical protein DMG16_27170 [Acidobacteria bacterium]|nr:MAG: hypothetical protein DMG16_27170 [Acidobacteriota bacterium]